MNFELELCRGLLTEQNAMRTFIEWKIKPSYFENDTTRAVLDYILRHYNKHGVLPNEAAVKLAVGQDAFDLETPEQPLSYYCECIILREQVNEAKRTTEDLIKIIGDNKVDAIAEKRVDRWRERAQKGLMKIVADLSQAQDIIIDSKERGQAAVERYEERQKNLGVLGVSYPWPELTNVSGGMEAGDITVISANTGVGKTWLLVYIALYVWLELGKKILFVSKEMHGDVIEDRFYSKLKALPYRMFRQGSLDEDQYRAFKEIVEQVTSTDSRRFIIIDDVQQDKSGVLEIEAKIEEYKPDILFIDGIYLISDDAGDDLDWKSVARVIYKLKRVLKKYEIPAVVTTQNKDLSKQGKGAKASASAANSTDSLAYSKDISRAASLMINLYQTDQDRAAKTMTMFLPKVREGERADLTLNWDFDRMDFSITTGEPSFSAGYGTDDSKASDAFPDEMPKPEVVGDDPVVPGSVEDQASAEDDPPFDV